MNEKKCVLTMKRISELTGLAYETVVRHQLEGWFNMDDPVSVAMYLSSRSVIQLTKPCSEKQVGENE